MSQITASLVKELRDRTGAGMMECKKALVETNGDIEAAIENMRKAGAVKAAKKAGRIAAEGVALTRFSADHKVATVVELNCETDFVAKDTSFVAFANEVADYAAANDVDSEALKAHFEDQRAALVAKIGENITVRRVVRVTGDYVGGYQHGAKIAVVVALNKADEEVAKQLGMHVASQRPEFKTVADIDPAVVAKELRVQQEIANEDPKFASRPAEIQEKILSGRMDKFKAEIALYSQEFVVEPDVTVEKFLAQKGLDVQAFARVEVGEGIEKKEEDFAAEVAKITSGQA